MANKKAPSKRPAKAVPKPSRLRKIVSCRWLLLIDNKPIHEAAVEEYQTLEEQIAQAREQIEAFETGDLPAYQRWEASAFGPLLTELRTMEQAIEEKRRILEAIEDEVFWGGCSYVAAYRRVMKAIESPEPEEEPEEDYQDAYEADRDSEETSGERLFGDRDLPRDFDIEKFDRSSKREQKKFREYYQMMAAMHRMFTGEIPPDLDELLERERGRKRGTAGNEGNSGPQIPGTPERPVEPQVDRKSDRLKELYRTLVRQLHPDTAREQTARERELWHEVQEAYRARDLERMEAVAGRVEIGLRGSALNLPVQILRRMTRDLRGALRGLRSHIAQVRKHPAWSFRRKAKDLPKLEKRRRQNLNIELARAKAALKIYTAELDRLAAQAKASRGGRRTKKKSTGASASRSR